MLLRQQIGFATSLFCRQSSSLLINRRSVSTLTPEKITEMLSMNQFAFFHHPGALPSSVKSIECSQLASNNPIEDRMRVSLLHLPGSKEPTLILGVFDGHGGGTTADLVSRRLFDYIALSLHPDPKQIDENHGLKQILHNLYYSPEPKEAEAAIQTTELNSLHLYKTQISQDSNVAAKLKSSFKRCDDDLSHEIQYNLNNLTSSPSTLHYYLSAAVSGCCALVMVIHDGIGYMASSGDCRAVLGTHSESEEEEMKENSSSKQNMNLARRKSYNFNAIELNDEHNCDNINEIKRLVASHPKSEQNTMIKYNRLLGHLMPFRAFGDFNYKWPADTIKACGITRAFGSRVIPSHYNTPPYLIAEPDITELALDDITTNAATVGVGKYVVMATDGLWEMFESSRDVVETVVNHSAKLEASQKTMEDNIDYDTNAAVHILRSALHSGSSQDATLDAEELRRLYHLRLESTLTLPQAVVRNFRDDISIILLKLR